MSKELKESIEITDREDGTILKVESNLTDWYVSRFWKDNVEPVCLSLEYHGWNDIEQLSIELNIEDVKELITFLQDRVDFLERS